MSRFDFESSIKVQIERLKKKSKLSPIGTERRKGGNWDRDLFVLEASPDVAELLVDAKALLLLVLAVANVADEDGETSHSRQGHLLRSSYGSTAEELLEGLESSIYLSGIGFFFYLLLLFF